MKKRLEMTLRVEEIEENVYLVVGNEVHSVFAGQVMFEFRICCGHPALIKEYFLELDMGQWTSQKHDIQAVVSPTRMTQEELNSLRMAAAEGVVEFVECYLDSKVIDPSDRVKEAMKNLIRIVEEGPSGIGPQVPMHLREFMVDQFSDMLLMLRSARNAHAADKIAAVVIDSLKHYDMAKDEPSAQSYLN